MRLRYFDTSSSLHVVLMTIDLLLLKDSFTTDPIHQRTTAGKHTASFSSRESQERYRTGS
jgi:hypothetical protein